MAIVHCRTSVDEEIIHYAADEEEEEEEEVMVREAEDYDDVMEFQRLRSVQSSELDKTRLCTRRIIAEDASWTLTIVPSLADICLRHIADNFCC